MENQEFETTNISDLWLRNIFENIKNLEHIERLAREGCKSIIEFIQMDRQTQIFMLPEIQYKNLSMMISEISLLLDDIISVIMDAKYKKFKKELERAKKVINKRDKFVKECFDRTRSQSRLKSRSLTKDFDILLEGVSSLKVRITKEIAPMLFVKKVDKGGKQKLK